MARGFGTTFGTNANDRITGGTSVTKGTTLSIAAWVWRNGAGGGNVGTIFAVSDSVFTVPYVDLYTTSTTTRFEIGWSTSTGATAAWTCPVLSNSVWHHLALTYDGGSTSNAPVMYIDGTSQTVTTVKAASGSLSAVTQPLCIGGVSGGTYGWDGKIAEGAFWNSTILTANEVKALSLGAAPFRVRPDALTLYCPLWGTASGEPDFGPNHYSMSVTGAAAQSHAPVQLFSGRNRRIG
ncbi:MAG: LamG domain-containing protein [Proteobacteria bacterium]|nr:LamG domain-containing protein [Pseudomonadota bacterium]